MSDGAPKTGFWRWIWGFIFIFLAHAAAVFWLNERSRPIAPPPRPKPLLHFVTESEGERRMAELGGADPTLFALPSAGGFSGEAWLNFAPAELASTNWSAPPSWLPLPVDNLATDFLAVAATNRIPVDPLLDDLHLATPFELRIPAGLLQAESELALDRNLARRGLVWAAALPTATNTDLLSNTVLEVTVNGSGFVESVTLLAACGLQAMDTLALAIAHRLQFQPLARRWQDRQMAVPERGRATFIWRVAPPQHTNGLTAITP